MKLAVKVLWTLGSIVLELSDQKQIVSAVNMSEWAENFQVQNLQKLSRTKPQRDPR